MTSTMCEEPASCCAAADELAALRAELDRLRAHRDELVEVVRVATGALCSAYHHPDVPVLADGAARVAALEAEGYLTR